MNYNMGIFMHFYYKKQLDLNISLLSILVNQCRFRNNVRSGPPRARLPPRSAASVISKAFL